MSWIRLTEDKRSTEAYTREKTLREHNFKVECAENNHFELLRIEVADRLYLDYLTLIYLGEEGEEDLGSGAKFIIDQGITVHFVFLKPKAGNYKITAKGAQYKFSVWGLDGDLVVPPLAHNIHSPFDVYFGLKQYQALLNMRVFYRAEGEEEFKTVTDQPDSRFTRVSRLNGEKTYEFKVQLFMTDLVETKMSKIIKISPAAPVFARFQPNEFLLNAALKFVVPIIPPSSCNITLQVRFPFGEWIQFTPTSLKSEAEDEDEYEEVSQLLFRLEEALYDKLNEDRVMEWQLKFEEKTTHQKISGPITPVLMTKRPKGYETIESTMHFEGYSGAALHLCKNGQFGLRSRPNGAKHIDVRGQYEIGKKDSDHTRLIIYPQTYANQPIYKLKFGSGSHSGHDVFSLPDIMDILLDYVITTQTEKKKLHNIIQVNLVSKEWYKSLRRVLKIHAFIDYSEYSYEEPQLVVNHWLDMSYVTDLRLFCDYYYNQDLGIE